MKYVIIVSAVLAGCATAPGPEPELPPVQPPETAPAPRSENAAVAGLLENARADATAGRLANAAATLERALRIEPRNPRLWHELARVRLKQGQFAQAESVAARSNSWRSDARSWGGTASNFVFRASARHPALPICST